MANIRILILEDDTDQGKLIRQKLLKRGYEVTAVSDELQEALGLFYAQKPDIVIIDIYLNGKPDGITFAQRINENPHTLKPFVFLTSAMDRETFEQARLTNPYSYLLKPFNELELQYSLELALEKFANLPSVFSTGKSGGYMVLDAFMLVKKKNSLIKVLFAEIELAEVDGKYTSIHTDMESFLVEISLKSLLQKLPSNVFIQVHRNYAVNINKIKKLYWADNLLELTSGKNVTISRRFKNSFFEHYLILK